MSDSESLETAGQAGQLSTTLDVPSDILLNKEIGRGNFGPVFAAHFRGQRAAVKAVPVDSMYEDRQREIMLLTSCDTDWIVRYYGCLQKARTLWIAMELCDGSVFDVLRLTSKPLLEDEIATVAAAMVRGLFYLHRTKKIPHRDIKAGKVLLSGSSGGGVKLCLSASVANQTKRSTGTPLWMSPDLIEYHEIAYAKAGDIWALGITCIEMAEQVRCLEAPILLRASRNARALPS